MNRRVHINGGGTLSGNVKVHPSARIDQTSHIHGSNSDVPLVVTETADIRNSKIQGYGVIRGKVFYSTLEGVFYIDESTSIGSSHSQGYLCLSGIARLIASSVCDIILGGAIVVTNGVISGYRLEQLQIPNIPQNASSFYLQQNLPIVGNLDNSAVHHSSVFDADSDAQDSTVLEHGVVLRSQLQQSVISGVVEDSYIEHAVVKGQVVSSKVKMSVVDGLLHACNSSEVRIADRSVIIGEKGDVLSSWLSWVKIEAGEVHLLSHASLRGCVASNIDEVQSLISQFMVNDFVQSIESEPNPENLQSAID